MIDVDGAKLFRFTHDRIQQAAYESIRYQERRAIHMKFGLALCYHTLNNGDEDEELFFAAVNQINQGGPSAVLEPSQKHVLAELNLKAGRRSIDLSDYNTAFTLFQFGLSFLGENSWATSYRISLDLHDSLTEVAMILNKPATVEVYAAKVIAHARCFDDKLNCKIARHFLRCYTLILSTHHSHLLVLPTKSKLFQVCALLYKLSLPRFRWTSLWRPHSESLFNLVMSFHAAWETTHYKPTLIR